MTPVKSHVILLYFWQWEYKRKKRIFRHSVTRTRPRCSSKVYLVNLPMLPQSLWSQRCVRQNGTIFATMTRGRHSHPRIRMILLVRNNVQSSKTIYTFNTFVTCVLNETKHPVRESLWTSGYLWYDLFSNLYRYM